MTRKGICKNINQYSEALYRVVKSYPKDTQWSANNLRIAINKFLITQLKLWNGWTVGYLIRILIPTKKFKIIRTKLPHGNVSRYKISLNKEAINNGHHIRKPRRKI